MTPIEEKKKPKAKGLVLKVFIFLLCAGLIFGYLNHVLSLGNDDSNRQIIKAFYAEEENTIDAVYLGTSASNRYFINPLAYNETGMSIFTVATMGMPMFFVPEMIDEVQKTQNPDLYVIELRWVLKDRDQITDAHIRRVTDSVSYFGNKYRMIDTAFDYMDGNTGMLDDISSNKLDYIFPIIKYHSKLAQGEVKKEDWYPYSYKNKTKGYVMTYNTLKAVNQFHGNMSEERVPLSDIAQRALTEVLDYCDDMDKDVLFVLSPYAVKDGQMPVFNTAIDMVKERGYDVVNFNTEEMYQELDLDWDNDFYNSKHVNYQGAEKYTSWLTDYISEKYDLEDHRGDEKYASWDESYKTYKDYVKGGIKVKGHKDSPGGEIEYEKVKK